MSCKNGLELNFFSISETYKDFFCGICMKFNCSLHGINFNSNYDNYDCYNLEYFAASFRILLNNTFALILEENEIGMVNTDEYIFRTNNDFIQFVMSSKNKFYELLRLHEITNKNDYKNNQIDKIFEINSKKNFICEKNSCSITCYIKFISCNEIQNIYQKIVVNLTNLELIMFEKLFKIFKFDPCAIYQSLKFFEKRPYNSNKILKKPKIRIQNSILELRSQGIISVQNHNIFLEDEHLNCTKVIDFHQKDLLVPF